MFWDSSAIIPLFLPEPRSAQLLSMLARDSEPTLWWGSPVECLSAVYRRHRTSPLPGALLTGTLARLRALIDDTDSVAPTAEVRHRAERLLATHPLRAADALQLGAALVWCEDQPAGEVLVCLDGRLRDAAAREGFSLRPTD